MANLKGPWMKSVPHSCSTENSMAISGPRWGGVMRKVSKAQIDLSFLNHPIHDRINLFFFKTWDHLKWGLIWFHLTSSSSHFFCTCGHHHMMGSYSEKTETLNFSAHKGGSSHFWSLLIACFLERWLSCDPRPGYHLDQEPGLQKHILDMMPIFHIRIGFPSLREFDLVLSKMGSGNLYFGLNICISMS